MSTPPTAEYVYVKDAATLRHLVAALGAAARVALDTEADSLHNYFEKVCLIQLSFAQQHFLLDPLAALDLRPLLEILAAKPLVLHGADYDLRMLRASFGFRPKGEVFDTMIAAQLLGLEQLGLAALLEKYFAVVIGKEGQKSDWSRRPLSDKQLDYAVNDTRYLETLAERMGAELGELNRSAWHRESCQAMVEATGRDRVRDPEDSWRIKGSGRLTPRQLAYLRELWQWRDQHARRVNVPPFKIFGNQQIFELLAWAESHIGAPLEQAPKLPRNIRGHLQQTLEAALAQAAALDSIQWPERRRGERTEPLDNQDLERLNGLRTACGAIAAELKIAPATLAPKAAIEAIVRCRPRSLDDLMQCSGLLRWQSDLIHGAVEHWLKAMPGGVTE